MSNHDQAMKDINVIAENLTITQSLELHKMISTIRNYINDTESLEKELKALKKDVARFMELLSKENTTNKEGFEVVTLGEKLSKVGKQE